MTYLPSILSTSALPAGTVYRTATMPPRSDDANSKGYHTATHLARTNSGQLLPGPGLGLNGGTTLSPNGVPINSLDATQGSSTTLNTTLKVTGSTSSSATRTRSQEKVNGEIRNITVLGCIANRLVVTYQGAGGVRAFIGTAHSLELKEVGDGNGSEKYHKYGGGKGFKYAEYEVPNLPTTIVVVGNTDGVPWKNCEDLTKSMRKPAREGNVRAQISTSGHVTKSHKQLLS